MSARERVPRRGVPGRTHRSAPTRWGRRSGTNGNRRDTTPFPAGRDGARPLQGTGAGRRQGALRVWLPPAKFRNGIWGVSHGHPALRKQRWWCAVKGRCGHRPLRGDGESPINHPGQRRTAERLRRGCEGMGGDRSRDHPKGTINAGQSLSQPAADSSLYAREPSPHPSGLRPATFPGGEGFEALT